jgi:calcineurin-like phosphoesterase family protein
MKFRDDIDPASTWVVSDTHFGHDNIVGFCHRPGVPVREPDNYGLLAHEEIMLSEWRKEVPDDATVLHLGDIAYRGNAVFKHLIAKELTGERKLIILGNHDRNPRNFYFRAGFQPVRPFAIPYVHEDEKGRFGIQYQISFSHYPWSDADEGRKMHPHDVRIHGHIHNNGYSRDAYVPFLKGHINLSVEQTHYKPVNLKLLLDAYLFGNYPETTQEQLDDARARKEQHQK